MELINWNRLVRVLNDANIMVVWFSDSGNDLIMEFDEFDDDVGWSWLMELIFGIG